MKKIIKFLPAMAILLASGLAVATTSKVNTPNVYKDPSDGIWKNLSGFSGEYDCLGDGECTAHRDELGNITAVNNGVFTPAE